MKLAWNALERMCQSALKNKCKYSTPPAREFFFFYNSDLENYKYSLIYRQSSIFVIILIIFNLYFAAILNFVWVLSIGNRCFSQRLPSGLTMKKNKSDLFCCFLCLIWYLHIARYLHIHFLVYFIYKID